MYVDDSIPETLEAFVDAVEAGNVDEARRQAEAADEAFRGERSGDDPVDLAVARTRTARSRLGVPSASRTAAVDEETRERRARLTEFLQRQGTIGARRAAFLGRAWGYVASDGERTDGLLDATETLTEAERERLSAHDAASQTVSETPIPPEISLLDESVDDAIPTGGGTVTVRIANVGDEAATDLSIAASVDGGEAAVREAPDSIPAETTGEVTVSVTVSDPGYYAVALSFAPAEGIESTGRVSVEVSESAAGDGDTGTDDDSESGGDATGGDTGDDDSGGNDASGTSGAGDGGTDAPDVNGGGESGDGGSNGGGGIGAETAVGVGAGLSALFGGGYLLKRRQGDDSGPEDDGGE